jgi:hypothetical protein
LAITALIRTDSSHLNSLRGSLGQRRKNSLSVEHPIAGDELRAIKRYLAARDDRLPWLSSSDRCSFILARGSPLDAQRCGGASILETQRFLPLLVRGSRLAFMLLCVEPRVIWRACSNRSLTIFDPFTFSHSRVKPYRLKSDSRSRFRVRSTFDTAVLWVDRHKALCAKSRRVLPNCRS